MLARRIAAALLLVVASTVPTHLAWAQTKTWTATADFSGGTLAGVSDSKFADEVVLGPTAVSQMHAVWSDNFNYGLVVRLDSLTGKQTARYDSARVTVDGKATGARPANEFCNWSNTGNCPQYAAVDTSGNLWIANSAYGSQGTLTERTAAVAPSLAVRLAPCRRLRRWRNG